MVPLSRTRFAVSSAATPMLRYLPDAVNRLHPAHGIVLTLTHAPVAQLDRATASEAVGQTFESSRAHHPLNLASKLPTREPTSAHPAASSRSHTFVGGTPTDHDPVDRLLLSGEKLCPASPQFLGLQHNQVLINGLQRRVRHPRRPIQNRPSKKHHVEPL